MSADSNSSSSLSTNAEKHEFQAEISQLMNIVVNSLYSNRDVFLRELVSNASDAINKAKYFAFQNDKQKVALSDYVISVIPDKENKTIVVSDSGIGQTKLELVKNLGTLAHSSTKLMIEKMKEEKSSDISLIGSYGLGFYSSLLVSAKIICITRHMDATDDEVWHMWSSAVNETSFTVRELTKDELESYPSHYACRSYPHGTDVILHLKDDAEEYLEPSKLESIIKTHSQFLDNSIRMWKEKTVTEQVPDDEEKSMETINESEESNETKEGETKEGETDEETKDPEQKVEPTDEGKVEEVDEKKEYEEKKPKMKDVARTVQEWEPVVLEKPIWLRTPEDISDAEYMSTYRAISGELHKYSALKHIKGEGEVEFKGIIYLPANPQRDLYDSKKETTTIKLYSKGVFITDKCKELLPEWLEFVYGAVESDSIPLNVSRELLQGNKALKVIGKHILKKSIELLGEVMNDEEKCKEFYPKFSKSIKFGVNSDYANRGKLMDLLRYETNKTEDASGELISLDTYVSRMKPNQTEIYCICGESKKLMQDSPYLDKLKEYGYEYIFMTEALDEYLLQSNLEFKGKKFANVAKVGLKIKNPDPDAREDEEEEKEREKKEEEALKPLTEKLADILKAYVNKVQISRRVTTAPCVVCAPEWGTSANMERILRAQALRGGMNFMETNNKVLEVNPEHRVIKSLLDRVSNTSGEDDISHDVTTMYKIACLNAGYPLDDINKFTMDLFEKLV